MSEEVSGEAAASWIISDNKVQSATHPWPSPTAHSQSMLLTPSVRVGLPRVQRLAALPTARQCSDTLRPACLQHPGPSRRGSTMAPRASETETPNSNYQYDQIKDVKVHAGACRWCVSCKRLGFHVLTGDNVHRSGWLLSRRKSRLIPCSARRTGRSWCLQGPLADPSASAPPLILHCNQARTCMSSSA